MQDVRRFGPEVKSPIPNPDAVNVTGVMIQIPSHIADQHDAQKVAQKFRGKPIIVDHPTVVETMYFDAHSEIAEHDASFPILFMVIHGTGYVRIGGAHNEPLAVKPGDALLWPENEPHKAWTDGEPMQAIVVQYHTQSRSP